MADSEEDWIKTRAYRMWEEEGYPTGKDTEHWERARLEFITLKPIAESAGSSKRKSATAAKVAAKPAANGKAANGKSANGKHAEEAAKPAKTKTEKPAKAASPKPANSKAAAAKTSPAVATETLPKKRAKKATASP